MEKHKMIWTKKDLLGLEYLSKEEIEHILYAADKKGSGAARQDGREPFL
jgi:hypothetical protein